MCLVAISLGKSRRFPLVLASNRDEFFERESAPLGWWTPSLPAEAGARPVLGGRDLRAQGTWLGLGADCRLALVTNVRSPKPQRSDARTRGELVTQWLHSQDDMARFWAQVDGAQYNGFNLLAADAAGRWYWATNTNTSASPRQLAPGVYGVSNAGLDSDWPKITRLKLRLAEALIDTRDDEAADALFERLFAALADRSVASDAALPSTGVSLELERTLSAAFIHAPDGRYGTRSSTLVVREQASDWSQFHVVERSFEPDGRLSAQRHFTLTDDHTGAERKT